MKRLSIALIMALATCTFATTADNYAPVTYTGNGSSTAFSVSWPIVNTSDAVVILKVVDTQVPTTLSETTDYVISATNNDYSSGFTVTTTATYSSSYSITIMRESPQSQQTDLDDSGLLRLENLESAYDKLTRLIQELQEQWDRSLHIPATESSTTLAENSVDRASSYPYWDVSGNLTSAAGTTEVTAHGTFGATLAGSTTQATALSHLNRDNQYVVTDTVYGAVGDGVTDDTIAIQSAINDANDAGGGVVYLPIGDYMVKGTLTMYSNISIKGNGLSNNTDSRQSWKTRITHDPTSADANLFELENNGQTFCYSMAIKNLAMIGQSDGTCGTAISWTTRPINSLIESCWIYNFDEGIVIGGGVNNVIEKTNTQNYTAYGEYGIVLQGGADSNSVNTTTQINNCYLTGGLYGCLMKKALDTTFLQTKFESNKYSGVNVWQECGTTSFTMCYTEDNPISATGGAYPMLARVGHDGTGATGYTCPITVLGGQFQGTGTTVDSDSSFIDSDYSTQIRVYGAEIARCGKVFKTTANTLRGQCYGVSGSSVTSFTSGIADISDWNGDFGSVSGIDDTTQFQLESLKLNAAGGSAYMTLQATPSSSGTLFWGNSTGNLGGINGNGKLKLGDPAYAANAHIDVNGFSRTQIDGSLGDVGIQDDLEVDGDAYIEGSALFWS